MSERRPAPAVAGGHPATAAAGLAVLQSGGSAADAAVAAVLASCVAETVMTGLGGGGFATHFSAATGRVTCLDFFTAVPGLGTTRAPAPMRTLEIAFGGVAQAYAAGGASVAVPGVVAGCGEVHRRWGRAPWKDVVAPAASLAGEGVPMPAAHLRTLRAVLPAMLVADGVPAYTAVLEGAGPLRHPGLERALDLLAADGPEAFYRGDVADATVAAVQADGGVLGHEDLAAYRVLEVEAGVAHTGFGDVVARTDLNGTRDAFAGLPPDLAERSPAGRAVALAHALGGPELLGDTTNVTVVDAAGDACVVTTSLGLGAGVWVPGLGIHLNSMLGEGELLRGAPAPGERMESMMCPLVVLDSDGLALAGGAAGASRIRTALLSTVTGVLVDGLVPQEAVDRPRFHRVGGVVHLEPGVPDDVRAALEGEGYRLQEWDGLDHYFGGASVVGRDGAGADPRRGGAAHVL